VPSNAPEINWRELLQSTPDSLSFPLLQQVLKEEIIDFVGFAFESGLLDRSKHDSITCLCGGSMDLREGPDLGTAWHCAGCRTRRAVLPAIFGHAIHISPCSLLLIILYWVRGNKTDQVSEAL
jgi:hypothetical protein